ncbi:MAG: homoserine O-succinyltransferase, partial [Clostridioides sp.]|nr:homoserine O-succinyltransferase [Clostridioides sp.]
KINTERDLLRRLSKSPVDIYVEFITLDTRKSSRVCNNYIDVYYETFSNLKKNTLSNDNFNKKNSSCCKNFNTKNFDKTDFDKTDFDELDLNTRSFNKKDFNKSDLNTRSFNRKDFDGIIITGAPIEEIEFEEVDYWNELCDFIDYAEENSNSVLFICWAAQAALYKKYKINKRKLKEKCFGVFSHNILTNNKILENINDGFFAPHSRHTYININDIKKQPELELVSVSDFAGAYIIADKKNIYVTGHGEYDKYTLDKEYKRDIENGKHIQLPQNYYKNNNVDEEPEDRWKETSEQFFLNLIKYKF